MRMEQYLFAGGVGFRKKRFPSPLERGAVRRYDPCAARHDAGPVVNKEFVERDVGCPPSRRLRPKGCAPLRGAVAPAAVIEGQRCKGGKLVLPVAGRKRSEVNVGR